MKKEKYKTAIQGYFGSYTHETVNEIAKKFDLPIEAIEAPTFQDQFQEIEKKGFGLVPIENSNQGIVASPLDLFRKYDFEIIGEYYFKVNHTMLVNKGVKFKDVKKAYSHPQAVDQCNIFLAENGIESVAFGDTAGSAKYISENNIKNIAAIGSRQLAELYNLEIIKEKFQNSENNITRFLLVKNKKIKLSFEEKIKNCKGDFKTSIIFEARDIPGALYKSLGGFATNNVNLLKIESRPSGKKNFHYYFLIEFKGHAEDENVKKALEELEFFSDNYKILGSYKELK